MFPITLTFSQVPAAGNRSPKVMATMLSAGFNLIAHRAAGPGPGDQVEGTLVQPARPRRALLR